MPNNCLLFHFTFKLLKMLPLILLLLFPSKSWQSVAIIPHITSLTASPPTMTQLWTVASKSIRKRSQSSKYFVKKQHKRLLVHSASSSVFDFNPSTPEELGNNDSLSPQLDIETQWAKLPLMASVIARHQPSSSSNHFPSSSISVPSLDQLGRLDEATLLNEYADLVARSSDTFGNDTILPFEPTYIELPPSLKVFFYCIYSLIFVLGVCGNALVCYVVAKNRSMQTVTNYFITNLALSDILLCLFAVPITPLYLLYYR